MLFYRLLFCLIFASLACEPQTGNQIGQGEEGGPCGPDGECFGELVCASNFCVDLGGSGDGSGDGSTTGSSNGSTTGSSNGSTTGSGEGTSDAGTGASGTLSCNSDRECTYIKDGYPNLEWQACANGITGERCELGRGLQLQQPEMVSHCESLSFGGFDDWVLPNIDQVRTLVTGCADTEPGGSCHITHECAQNNNCGEDNCSGCFSMQGPGTDGCYWPTDLSVPCGNSRLWSASIQSEIHETMGTAYSVYMRTGRVEGRFYSDEETDKFWCVRERP